MLTVNDFRKLSELEDKGYFIYIDGEQANGLHYDEELDWTEFVDACEEMRCTFVFADDRYTTVQYLKDFQNADWWVEQHIRVPDWKAL